MADEAEILDTLSTLADYFGTEPTDKQLRLYVRALSDLTPDELEHAAAEHIKVNKWFPKVSELRELVEKRTAQKSPQRDELEVELYACEDAFYAGRAYDAGRLEHMAYLYEQVGREHKAAWVREKSRRWAAILEVENAQDGNRTRAGDTAARTLPAGTMAAGVRPGVYVAGGGE